MMRMILAMLSGIMLVGAGPVGGQFNLDCKKPDGSPSLDYYRIDLNAGEWCINSCPKIRKIAGVTSGVIILQEISPDEQAHVEVNRITGELNARFWGVRSWIEYTLVCERAPFTGLLNATTKF